VSEHPGFAFVHHDVTEPLRLPGRFGLVFALASPASPLDYQRLPLETLRAGARGTEHALQLAQQQEARFVLTSTSEVYGDPIEHPQPESYWGRVNPVGPRSVYDEAKRYAEALTVAYRRTLDADTVIARIFNTYGPRMRTDDGRMVPTFIRQALDSEPLTVHGTGAQTRALCYVSDTVAGLIALADSGEAGPINLGDPHEKTVLEVAAEITRQIGNSAGVRHLDPVTDDPRQRCPDISLATELFGWRPTVGLPEGLRRTIASVAAEPRESPMGVLTR
jgi:dTDP-glucose 4,6-dehydratase